ncbi:hypothetical protein D3C74_216160 [compost metagenome]
MKKWAYIITAFILGVVVASSAGDVSAQVKSLIGKKVTGEMTVIVNDQKLLDKGAVIDGKTNAPVRALADSLGAELKVEGNTIYISSVESEANQLNEEDSNKYSRMTKVQLEEKKGTLEKQIETLNSGKKEILDLIEKTKQIYNSTTDSNLIKLGEEKIESLNKDIQTLFDPQLEQCQAELDLVKSALSNLNK